MGGPCRTSSSASRSLGSISFGADDGGGGGGAMVGREREREGVPQ